jgi:hypothetical protein
MDEKKWIAGDDFYKCDTRRFYVTCAPIKINNDVVKFALQVIFPNGLTKEQVSNIVIGVQDVIESNVIIKDI